MDEVVNIKEIENYEELDKSFLILRIKQLERHVFQLQNVIKKFTRENEDKIFERKFDFANYNKRHVLLKILYLGWDYKGYVVQENIENTIEHHVFKALEKTKLIESRQTSNYHRCGRTDKGVNAYSQIISIDLRTNMHCGEGINHWDGSKTPETTNYPAQVEINYCKLLNRVLPYNIRVYAWAPVDSAFSARFDCSMRTYRYIMPTQGTSDLFVPKSLDIKAMRLAADKLVGHHDFRNLCRMDVANGVTNFERTLRSVTFTLLDQKSGEDVANDNQPGLLLMAEIVAPSFLWHQVRCLVAILMLVGSGKEDPSLIDHMFGSEAKPQYNMAPDYPLILWDCSYEKLHAKHEGDTFLRGSEGAIGWFYDKSELNTIVTNFKELWIKYCIKGKVLKLIIDDLLEKLKCSLNLDTSSTPYNEKSHIYDTFRTDSFSKFLPQNSQSSTYHKLVTRPCGQTLDETLYNHKLKTKIKRRGNP